MTQPVDVRPIRPFTRAQALKSRPAGAITVAIRNAGHAEIENQSTALAMARRLERDLAAEEPRLTTLPTVTLADPSAGVLAKSLQLPSEIARRKLRLALLLVLPLCAGLVLAIGTSVGPPTTLAGAAQWPQSPWGRP